jgi:hypothetical protein
MQSFATLRRMKNAIPVMVLTSLRHLVLSHFEVKAPGFQTGEGGNSGTDDVPILLRSPRPQNFHNTATSNLVHSASLAQ